jgi:hypothetical protein
MAHDGLAVPWAAVHVELEMRRPGWAGDRIVDDLDHGPSLRLIAVIRCAARLSDSRRCRKERGLRDVYIASGMTDFTSDARIEQPRTLGRGLAASAIVVIVVVIARAHRHTPLAGDMR